MSDIFPVSGALTKYDARSLTDEAKRDAEALWMKLLRLHEGDAHTALGYKSWGAYCQAEFEVSRSRAYQLLDAGRVLAVLQSTTVDPAPANEAQVRELAPLRGDPEALRETWAEVVQLHEEHGDRLTAAKVREAVDDRLKRDHTLTVMGSSEFEDWPTPQDLFDILNAEFRFDRDVCALPETAKCAAYFTPDDDALSQDWHGVCFMNPPYGKNIGPWMRKACEAAQTGATVVCLVPARVDTAWWWDYALHGEIRFLRGRLKTGPQAWPFPSAVVVLGREPRVIWWER